MSILFGLAAILCGCFGVKVERAKTIHLAITFASWVAVVAILAFASMRFGGVL
jgi:hypothetical protein